MNHPPVPQSIDVMGVPIAATNLSAATESVLRLAESGHGGYICITGAHGVIEAQDDPGFADILRGSLFNTPDGMPNVWMGRYLHGSRAMDRVYGPDLMREVFDGSQERDVRHFFYGGKDGVAGRLEERLVGRFPGARVVGTCTPPFRPLTPEEESDLLRQIEECDPNVIWVGLSTPKQERFMAEWTRRLPGRVMLGVGAAFDFHAGLVPSAPEKLQRAGLEWFYRLCTEPKRLWPRYSKIVPRFLWGSFRQIARSQLQPQPQPVLPS